MHRPTVWRATISQIPSTASRRTGRRFASSFVGRATGRATGTLLRWGLAGAAVYYYNTASVFADEPRYANQSVADAEAEPLSLDAIAEQRRAQAKTTANVRQDSATVSAVDEQTPEGLEEEAAQQGAFNEETGEINWDCPCLGGMANGPCGEHFKTAFSCFVFSKEEPKGVDCIEHFKAMQNCFREYPDIYGAELEDEEEAVEDISGPQHAVEVAKEKVNETVEQTADAINAGATSLAGTTQAAVKSTPQPETAVTSKQPSQVPAPSSQTQGLKGDESSDVLVPRSWHDSTNDNDTKSSQQK